MNLQELLDKFIHYLTSETKVSPHTVTAYRWDLQIFLSSGVQSLQDITPISIAHFIKLEEERGVKASTLLRRIASIKAFFRYLRTLEIWENDPTRMLKISHFRPAPPSFLTSEEMERILLQPDTQSLTGIRDRAFLRLLYITGSSISEILEMSADDVEENFYWIRLTRKNKYRILTLDSASRDILGLYTRSARSVLLARNPDNKENKFFLSRTGKPLGRDSAWHIVKKYARKAGILRAVSPRTFRNSFAVYSLQKGRHLKEIQEKMGYQQITSLQKYLEFS